MLYYLLQSTEQRQSTAFPTMLFISQKPSATSGLEAFLSLFPSSVQGQLFHLGSSSRHAQEAIAVCLSQSANVWPLLLSAGVNGVDAVAVAAAAGGGAQIDTYPPSSKRSKKQKQQQQLSPLDHFLYSNKKGRGPASHPSPATAALSPGRLLGQQQQQSLEQQLREKSLRKQFMSSKVRAATFVGLYGSIIICIAAPMAKEQNIYVCSSYILYARHQGLRHNAPSGFQCLVTRLLGA